MGYTVPDRIKTDVSYKIRKDRLKSTSMMTFTGTFIPDFLGIGKSVSRCFGTVKRAESGVPSRNP